jgi:hypothetical protein
MGDYVLALTRHRLVAVHESRVVHRVRLHLDAPLHELSEITWGVDAIGTTLELAATAIDGIRERFAIRLRRRAQRHQLDVRLAEVFGRTQTSRLASAA